MVSADTVLLFLLAFLIHIFYSFYIQVPRNRPKGNPVKFRDGPAAVIGDENCRKPLSVKNRREGAVSRMIHKSEDLPEYHNDMSHVVGAGNKILDKKRDTLDRLIQQSARGFVF